MFEHIKREYNNTTKTENNAKNNDDDEKKEENKANDVDNENILNTLAEFIESEQYDSDSIILDADIFNNHGGYSNEAACNIFYALNNNIKCVECINSFVKYKNISSNSFSTGFCFWYHPFYQNVDADQQVKAEQIGSWEQNDFGGLSVRDLHVSAHFLEALNSAFIDIKMFNDNVIHKGNQYVQTTKCKRIKCIHKNGRPYQSSIEDPLHYSVGFGAALCKSHLYSLILYCDFTDFCTSFSSTFRRIKWNETIKQVKQRNTKYANIAKYLREIIQYYGITGRGTEYDEESRKWIN